MNTNGSRSRWAAVGAVLAITLGAGGIGITHATTSSGEKPVFKPIEPCRLADLRPAPFQVGPRPAPLAPNETYTLSGWGAVGECTLPTGTTGLALNVTAVGATQDTFLTFFPAASTRPNASNLNPSPGQPPTPNAVNIDLDAAGQFSVYNLDGNVNVIIDVVGVYDDHNHDDRYYTEAEIDAVTPIAAGFVNGAGVLGRSFGTDSSTFNAGFTQYEIVFIDESFFSSSYAVSVTGTCPNAVARYTSVGGDLVVQFRSTSTQASVSCATGFSFVVYELPT
jgi:hypothetical protein